MKITFKELTVPFNPAKSDALLDDWRWLVGRNVQLLLVSAFGDLFLRDGAGTVHWLETGAGRYKRIATSADEFRGRMQQREYADSWFSPEVVGDLITRGMRLQPNECYSYIKPPQLGGDLGIDNVEAADLEVHCSMFGQIAKQVKDLPPGAKIGKIKIE